MEISYLEIIFQTFRFLFTIRKVDQQKIFSNKKKISLIYMKVFSFYFGRKTLSRSCEKFKNILLFVDYIKFDIQFFYYYIFCFEFLSISSLRIWFNLIFISILVFILLIVICFSLILFLIEIFYLSFFVPIFFIVICFIWNNLWNWIIFFNFIIFQFFYLSDLFLFFLSLFVLFEIIYNIELFYF